MSSILKVIERGSTMFKQTWELQSTDPRLREEDKYEAREGEEFQTIFIERFDNSNEWNNQTGERLSDYWYVRFQNELKGRDGWYVYKLHVQELDSKSLY